MHGESTKQFKLISPATLKSLPVPVLKDGRRLEYERKAIPLLKAMEANASESRTLANLRDTLLPKLMSG